MAGNLIDTMRLPRRLEGWLPATLTVFLQGANSLSNLAIAWWLVRQIGVDGFGIYSFQFVVAINATAVAGALLVNPLNSIGSQRSQVRQEQFVAAATLGHWLLLAGLAGTALLAAGIARAAAWDWLAVLTAFAFVGAMASGEFWRRIGFFRHAPRCVAGYDLLRYALLAGFLGLLPAAVAEPGSIAYTLAIAATYPLAIALQWPFVRRVAASASKARRLADLRRLVRTGKWLGGVAFMKFLDGGAVLLVAFAVLGPYVAGLIRLAQTIVSLTQPAMQSLEHLVPRMLGQAIRRDGRERALRDYRRHAVLAWGGFALLYLLLVLASPLLLRLMGVEPSPLAVGLVGGFSLVYLFTVGNSLVEFRLRAVEQARIVTTTMFVSGLVAAALMYPLIAWAGAAGMISCIVLTRLLTFARLLTWQDGEGGTRPEAAS